MGPGSSCILPRNPLKRGSLGFRGAQKAYRKHPGLGPDAPKIGVFWGPDTGPRPQNDPKMGPGSSCILPRNPLKKGSLDFRGAQKAYRKHPGLGQIPLILGSK